MYTDLFRRRAQRDTDPPDIFDNNLFGSRYLAVESVTSVATHSKLLLGIFERHMSSVRSLCGKLKSEGNEVYLREVHFMLRALLYAVRDFCYHYCFEDIKDYVCASLLQYDNRFIFFLHHHCNSQCVDILRLLSCIQNVHPSLDEKGLQDLQAKVSRWAGVTYTLCDFHCCL